MNMSNTTNIDFRTPKQRERDIRDKRICNQFVTIKAAHPDKSVNSIARVIATAEGVTPACIQKVLSKYQII